MVELKVAVCFFGITRSLSYTFPSICRRILRPAESVSSEGSVRVFGHFFEQQKIANTRSGEFGILDTEEYLLLNASSLELEAPDTCLDNHGFDQLKVFGDPWEDDFQSLRNLVHQLHSLSRVTTLAQDWDPDVVIFARPDLHYHQSLARPLGQIIRCKDKSVAAIPSWQGWLGGLNDRFSICTSSAAGAYGHRVRDMHEFCISNGPLHAELLVRHSLEKAGVEVQLIPTLASRVRFDGRRKGEAFTPPGASRLRRYITRLQIMT